MSNPHPLDQIRYCERCGISFLWSAEEQRNALAPKQDQDQQDQNDQAQNNSQNNKEQASTSPPSHCPACRLLLPRAERERGLVKWYNHRKRYGFLVRRDQPEIFAHGSDIQRAKSLRPGDLVEFRVEAGERGPAAKEITIIGHTDPPI